ncbi:MAG: sigma-70 family RNA polymerase sigma factor [Rikenellaceae bacterium]
MKIDEGEILRRLTATNDRERQSGFIEMMKRYQQQIYWHVRRLVVLHEDAEDIVQDTFINVYRHIDSFKGNSSLKTWLYKISTNEALKHLTKKRIETSSYDNDARLMNLFEADDDIDFETTEAKLQRAILTLPPKQQAIFNLRYFDELDYQHIAQITDSNIVALKSNYYYAKKRVTESLLNQLED